MFKIGDRVRLNAATQARRLVRHPNEPIARGEPAVVEATQVNGLMKLEGHHTPNWVMSCFELVNEVPW